MEKSRSRNSCVTCILWSMVILLCVVTPIIGSAAWFGTKIYNIAVATPTPISTCEGMLEAMLHGFFLPDGEKVVTDSLHELVVYQVSGDQISNPNLLPAPDNLKPFQADLPTQQRIWDYFVRIIPPENRSEITQYKIISDGTGNFNAQVYIEAKWDQNSTTEKWTLLVDQADFVNERQYTTTLLHEFGHMLTLNINQMDYSLTAENCPRYFKDPGCSKPNTYLQLFYDRFWAGIYDEWRAVSSSVDPTQVKIDLKTFYDAHPKDFVSEYATTAAHEDIAESWMKFVLAPKSAGETLAEKKVAFFYEFPELVQIRSEVIGLLCRYNNLPPLQ